MPSEMQSGQSLCKEIPSTLHFTVFLVQTPQRYQEVRVERG